MGVELSALSRGRGGGGGEAWVHLIYVNRKLVEHGYPGCMVRGKTFPELTHDLLTWNQAHCPAQ